MAPFDQLYCLCWFFCVGGFGSYLFGMSPPIAKQIPEFYTANDVKSLGLGWMIAFLFVVSFLGEWLHHNSQDLFSFFWMIVNVIGVQWWMTVTIIGVQWLDWFCRDLQNLWKTSFKTGLILFEVDICYWMKFRICKKNGKLVFFGNWIKTGFWIKKLV
jgi:hypothetical protein